MCRKFLSIAVSAVALMASGAENLIPNGDFSGNNLTGWSFSSRPASIKTYVVKDGIMTGSCVAGINRKDFIAASFALPELEQKTVYEFGAKIKINAVPGVKKSLQIAIREVGAKGRTIGYSNIYPNLNAKGEWIIVQKSFTARRNAVGHQFYIVLANFQEGENVEIDEVFVRKAAELTAAEGNLMKNGDFEAGVSGWFSNDANCTSTAVAIDAARGKVLRISGDPASKYNGFKTIVREIGKLPAGKYSLSFAASAKVAPGKGKACYVRVRKVDAKGKTIRYIGAQVKLNTADWQEYAATVNVSGKAANNYMFISVQNLAADDVILIDNIKLIKQ